MEKMDCQGGWCSNPGHGWRKVTDLETLLGGLLMGQTLRGKGGQQKIKARSTMGNHDFCLVGCPHFIFNRRARITT